MSWLSDVYGPRLTWSPNAAKAGTWATGAYARIRRQFNMPVGRFEGVEAVIARQMPDAEKRRKADVVVRTGLSRNHTLKALHWLIRELRG